MDKGAKKRIRTCPCCESSTAGKLVHFTGRRAVCDMCATSLAKRGKAWCNICKSEVPVVNYRPAMARCVVCMSSRRHAYYQTHQEQERATSRQWRIDNSERSSERVRAYRQNNRERLNTLQRARYAKDRERFLVRNRASRRKHADKRAESLRSWIRQNPDKWLSYGQKARLKKKLSVLHQLRKPFEESHE